SAFTMPACGAALHATMKDHPLPSSEPGERAHGDSLVGGHAQPSVVVTDWMLSGSCRARSKQKEHRVGVCRRPRSDFVLIGGSGPLSAVARPLPRNPEEES